MGFNSAVKGLNIFECEERTQFEDIDEEKIILNEIFIIARQA
jgi:hypothetical protein